VCCVRLWRVAEQIIRACAEESGYYDLLSQATEFINEIDESALSSDQRVRLQEVRSRLQSLEALDLQGPIIGLDAFMAGLERTLSDAVTLSIHSTGYADIKGPDRTRTIQFAADYSDIAGHLGIMCDPSRYNRDVAQHAQTFTQSPPRDALPLLIQEADQ